MRINYQTAVASLVMIFFSTGQSALAEIMVGIPPMDYSKDKTPGSVQVPAGMKTIFERGRNSKMELRLIINAADVVPRSTYPFPFPNSVEQHKANGDISYRIGQEMTESLKPVAARYGAHGIWASTYIFIDGTPFQWVVAGTPRQLEALVADLIRGKVLPRGTVTRLSFDNQVTALKDENGNVIPVEESGVLYIKPKKSTAQSANTIETSDRRTIQPSQTGKGSH